MVILNLVYYKKANLCVLSKNCLATFGQKNLATLVGLDWIVLDANYRKFC